MEKIALDQAQTGSFLVLDTLRKLGVDTIFGYPGGAVLPLYDEIYRFEGIRHILGRHEQGSVHEAEGFAKSSGKIGVALVTSGSGATNAITGIADAMGDSVPLLVFTGQVATPGIGKDAFQEADIIGATMPVTKYNYQIRDTADIPRMITEAVHIATTGRPGPVVIDLPKDVQEREVDFYYDPIVHLPSYQPTVEPNGLQIKKLLQALSETNSPLILAGGGVNYAGAQEELLAFAECYRIPVVSTLLGLGSMPIEIDEIEQITKQLNRQIDVVHVRDITDIPHLEREVLLVKISAPAHKRAEILAIIQPFRAGVVDVAPHSITIQMTGDSDKIEAILRVIQPYGIKNIARTGATGFSRD